MNEQAWAALPLKEQLELSILKLVYEAAKPLFMRAVLDACERHGFRRDDVRRYLHNTGPEKKTVIQINRYVMPWFTAETLRMTRCLQEALACAYRDTDPADVDAECLVESALPWLGPRFTDDDKAYYVRFLPQVIHNLRACDSLTPNAVQRCIRLVDPRLRPAVVLCMLYFGLRDAGHDPGKLYLAKKELPYWMYLDHVYPELREQKDSASPGPDDGPKMSRDDILSRIRDHAAEGKTLEHAANPLELLEQAEELDRTGKELRDLVENHAVHFPGGWRRAWVEAEAGDMDHSSQKHNDLLTILLGVQVYLGEGARLIKKTLGPLGLHSLFAARLDVGMSESELADAAEERFASATRAQLKTAEEALISYVNGRLTHPRVKKETKVRLRDLLASL